MSDPNDICYSVKEEISDTLLVQNEEYIQVKIEPDVNFVVTNRPDKINDEDDNNQAHINKLYGEVKKDCVPDDHIKEEEIFEYDKSNSEDNQELPHSVNNSGVDHKKKYPDTINTMKDLTADVLPDLNYKNHKYNNIDLIDCKVETYVNSDCAAKSINEDSNPCNTSIRRHSGDTAAVLSDKSSSEWELCHERDIRNYAPHRICHCDTPAVTTECMIWHVDKQFMQRLFKCETCNKYSFQIPAGLPEEGLAEKGRVRDMNKRGHNSEKMT